VFGLTRNVTVTWNDGAYEVIPELNPDPTEWKKKGDRSYSKAQSIPLLWCYNPSSSDDYNPTISQGMFDAPLKREGRFFIRAKFPIAVTDEERFLYNKARAVYQRGMVDLLDSRIMSPYMVISRYGISLPTNTLEAFWIPKLEDLTAYAEPPVNPDDPALVVRCGTERFLLKFWDTVHEDPIKAILSEFAL
jgi:hypothetical protein